MCNCVLPGLRACLTRAVCVPQGSNHQSVFRGCAETTDKRTARKKATLKWLPVTNMNFVTFFIKNIFSYWRSFLNSGGKVSGMEIFRSVIDNVF